MAALFAPIIVLSKVIFPSNRSDDEIGGLILAIYLATFIYYGTVGFLGVRKSLQVRDGIRVGALTALLGMGLIIAMFALVDNIFLETVSHEVDKIRAFQHSQYVSMRSYINWSHLKGAIFGLPVFGVIGAASGGFGGLLAARIYAETNS
jgi:hypothetical protein